MEDFMVTISNANILINLFADRTKGVYYSNFKEFKQQFNKYVDLLDQIKIYKKVGLKFLKQFTKKEYFQNNSYDFKTHLSKIYFRHQHNPNFINFVKLYKNKMSSNPEYLIARYELNKYFQHMIEIGLRENMMYHKIIRTTMNEFQNIEKFDDLHKLLLHSRLGN